MSWKLLFNSYWDHIRLPSLSLYRSLQVISQNVKCFFSSNCSFIYFVPPVKQQENKRKLKKKLDQVNKVGDCFGCKSDVALLISQELAFPNHMPNFFSPTLD